MSQEAFCLFSADQIMSIVVNPEGTEKNIYFSRACKNIGKMTPVLMSHVVGAAQHTVVQQICLCLSMLQTGLQHYLSRPLLNAHLLYAHSRTLEVKRMSAIHYFAARITRMVQAASRGNCLLFTIFTSAFCFPHPLKHLSKRQADDISF